MMTDQWKETFRENQKNEQFGIYFKNEYICNFKLICDKITIAPTNTINSKYNFHFTLKLSDSSVKLPVDEKDYNSVKTYTKQHGASIFKGEIFKKYLAFTVNSCKNKIESNEAHEVLAKWFLRDLQTIIDDTNLITTEYDYKENEEKPIGKQHDLIGMKFIVKNEKCIGIKFEKFREYMINTKRKEEYKKIISSHIFKGLNSLECLKCRNNKLVYSYEGFSLHTIKQTKMESILDEIEDKESVNLGIEHQQENENNGAKNDLESNEYGFFAPNYDFDDMDEYMEDFIQDNDESIACYETLQEPESLNDTDDNEYYQEKMLAALDESCELEESVEERSKRIIKQAKELKAFAKKTKKKKQKKYEYYSNYYFSDDD